MEISESKFVLFWAAISAIFLKLAFNTIDNTDLSNSVSPLVMFLFKHSSAMVTCYSYNHALRRSWLNKSAGSYLQLFTGGKILIFVILTGGSMVYCYFPIYIVASQYNLFMIASNNGRFSSKWKLVLYAWYIIATAFLIVLAFGRTNFKGHAKTLTMMAVTSQNIASIIISDDALFSSKWKVVARACYVTSGSCASYFGFGPTNVKGFVKIVTIFRESLSLPAFILGTEWDEGESLPETDPVRDPNLTIFGVNDDNKYYKIKKSVEFAVGLLGTILFQNFFRLNSYKEMVGFLYLAVAWLANITMLSASHDHGVFNFLLGNAIVGCSVSEFGLRGKTWIAYAASVFLFCLRLKIQSLSFENRGGNRKVILW